MTLKFAVIICTKNRTNDLDITLKSIFLQTLLPDILLIVDDSNNDATEQMIKKYSLLSKIEINYLHPIIANTGLPAARNYGIKNVPESADIIIFLDDDVTLDPHYFESIIKKFLSCPQADGVGGFILEGYHNRQWYEKPMLAMIGFLIPSLVPASPFDFRVTKTGQPLRPLYIQDNKISENTKWLSGSNMAYRTSVFKEGNVFDENFVRYAHGEDILFSHQLYKNGKKIFIATDAHLHHRVSKEDRLPSLTHVIMIFGYRKYTIQKFFGSGVAGKVYFGLFVMNFFVAAFVLSLIRKNNFSYFEDTVKAYNIFRVFGKKIGENDLKSFNSIFLKPDAK
jgi:GT2 family glycosyltransferase